MEKIEIEDVTYACKIWQDNQNHPYLLMLHGFMGDNRVFEHIAGKLTGSCNPIAIDLLGHGRSTKATEPHRFSEQRQVPDLLKLIEKLNIAPLYLYGYSMGGRLALKTALASPNLFHGLILENANCGITGLEERKEREAEDERRACEIERDFNGFLSAWEEKDLFRSSHTGDPELGKKYRTVQREQSPAAMAASLRGFGTGKMEPSEGTFRDFLKPVLLLAGSDDKKYQDIGHRMSRLFPLARLCVVEGGHRIHIDNPYECCRELINFIDINLTYKSL